MSLWARTTQITLQASSRSRLALVARTIHKGLVHVEANVRIEDAQQLRKLQVEPQSHPLSSNRLNFDSGQLAALMGVQATW